MSNVSETVELLNGNPAPIFHTSENRYIIFYDFAMHHCYILEKNLTMGTGMKTAIEGLRWRSCHLIFRHFRIPAGIISEKVGGSDVNGLKHKQRQDR
ncbi:MAG: hypothetical protein WCA35_08725 [Kovacikia sp.]